jgi:hypothetical protein
MDMNNNAKVKIPKKVAEAIDFYKRHDMEDVLFDLNRMAVRARNASNEHAREVMAYVNESHENRKTYFNALVNGYEIIKTPKEQAEELYFRYHQAYVEAAPNTFTEGYAKGFQDAISVLNGILDLKLSI